MAGLGNQRNVRRNNGESPLLRLPNHVLSKILAQNASGSLKDYFRATPVCKSIQEASADDDTLYQIDLIRAHTPRVDNWEIPQGVNLLKQACLQANNPTAMFLKGISDFMYSDEREKGFFLINHSAATGLRVAKYAYEVIRQSIAPELDVDSTVAFASRGTIRALRRSVAEINRTGWPPAISMHLAAIRDSVEPDSIVACQCAVYYYWLDWTHQNVKGLGMCDSCFWKIENLSFSDHT